MSTIQTFIIRNLYSNLIICWWKTSLYVIISSLHMLCVCVSVPKVFQNCLTNWNVSLREDSHLANTMLGLKFEHYVVLVIHFYSRFKTKALHSQVQYMLESKARCLEVEYSFVKLFVSSINQNIFSVKDNK